MPSDTIRARYTAGTIGARQVPAYVDEPGVDPSRETETYASLTLGPHSPRWDGVPFTLRSGKALETDSAEIAIHFRPLPRYLTERFPGVEPNVLRIGLREPYVRLATALNGPEQTAELRHLEARSTPPRFSAYAHLIEEMLRSDPMLFIRGDEAEEAWRIIDPVMAAWAAGDVPMQEYAAGTAPPGPSALTRPSSALTTSGFFEPAHCIVPAAARSARSGPPRGSCDIYLDNKGSVMNTFDGQLKPVAYFGGVAAVLYLVAIALSPTHAPDSGSAGVQIVHWATVHRSQLLGSYLAFALALAVLMVFAAGLYRIIRCSEGKNEWLAMASLTSVVAGAGIFGAGTALFMVVAYRPATDPAVARAFWDAGWLAYNTAGFGFSAWIAIVAVATLRRPVLPPWTVWVGFPVALIGLVGPFAVKAGSGPFSPQGWFALVVGLTFGVWLLAISLAAWRSIGAPALAAERPHPD